MGKLLYDIRDAVAAGNVIIGVHASDQLRARHITEWQAVSGLAEGRLIVERPDAKPYPAIEIEQLLPDGEPIKAVWSWIGPARFAKLVTVRYFDP